MRPHGIVRQVTLSRGIAADSSHSIVRWSTLGSVATGKDARRGVLRLVCCHYFGTGEHGSPVFTGTSSRHRLLSVGSNCQTSAPTIVCIDVGQSRPQRRSQGSGIAQTAQHRASARHRVADHLQPRHRGRLIARHRVVSQIRSRQRSCPPHGSVVQALLAATRGARIRT